MAPSQPSRRPAPELDTPSDVPHELRGDSTAIRHVRALVQSAASAAGPILILAERGFDVEAVAREIHRRSAGGPFVALDCESMHGPGAEQALDRKSTRLNSSHLGI